MRKRKKTILIAIFIIIIFIAGLYIGSKYRPQKIIPAKETKQITMSAPGIDNNNKGVMISFTTKITEGTGQVLVNINNILSAVDMQLSARTAASVAGKITKTNLNNLDITYSISANETTIAGPSAGAAMAIAAIALLQNKQLKPGITITGSINGEGSIESSGAIQQKAEAASQNNYKLLLVPLGYAGDIEIKEKIDFKKENSIDYYSIDYSIIKKDKEIENITVKEVKDVQEALTYFLTEPEKQEEIIEVDSPSEEFIKMEVSITQGGILFKSGCNQLGMQTSEDQIESIQGKNKITFRPNMHDIVKSLFSVSGIEILEAKIDRYKFNTYFAKLLIKNNNKIITIDIRPSDAVALALRTNAPIYIEKTIMESHSEKIC